MTRPPLPRSPRPPFPPFRLLALASLFLLAVLSLLLDMREAALAAASGKLRVPLFFIINAGIPLIFRTAGVFSPERLAIGAEMTA